MVEPIRILHFADLHIGMENYGRLDPDTGLNRRVVDFLDRLDEVVDHAIQERADLVLFAGDAFRTRTPSPTHQREFARRIYRLSEAEIPTILLVGNHDLPVMSQRASSVQIFSTLQVPHIIVAEAPAVHRIVTRHGAIQVATLPYPIRQRLLSREQYRRKSQEELDAALSEIVVRIVSSLAEKLDPDEPAVLVGHFSVAGARWGSERSIMVGRDVTVPVSALVDSRWDYVALGHIHQHQNLNASNDPPVVYAGSLERVDFGEEGQPKGFCWVEVFPQAHSSRSVSWRYVPLPARRFVTIRVDVRAASDPLQEIQSAIASQDIRDCVVRLIVQMTPDQEPVLRDGDLGPLLAEAFYVQINREVDRATRDRLAGLELDAMTPMRLLERYLLSRGKTPEELAPYLEAAQTFFAGDSEGEDVS